MPDRKESVEEREELAKERTDWALHRTMLAKERTLSAWMRTGLTSVAAGLGIARLLESPGVPAISRVVGVLLVAAGGGVFALALWRYRHGLEELRDEGIQMPPFWSISILVGSLFLAALLSSFLLFRL